MTGRIALAATLTQVLEEFQAEADHMVAPADHSPVFMPARYNIAPTMPILVITQKRTGRVARLMRWGFLPDWLKDPRDYPLVNTARCETVRDKPSFQNAIRRRRCLIPATGFYVWQQTQEGTKVPYHFCHPQRGVLALAGIWESWMGPNGEEIDGVAILTTRAPGKINSISERLPLIIAPEAYRDWMADVDHLSKEAQALMGPGSAAPLICFPVSDAVNHVAKDDPSLIEPVTADDPIELSSQTEIESEAGEQLRLF